MAKGLGRGFESLIPTELIDEEFDITAAEDKKGSEGGRWGCWSGCYWIWSL